MSFLRTLRKLLLGETWLLPVGLAIVLAATVLVRHLLGDGWHDVGGFVLLTGVAGVLLLSVAVSARPR
jgi:hypothetical protein